jgi:periplasmic copper chaperone A
MSLPRTILAFIALALAVPAAQAYTTVSILQPWARATKAGQKVSAAYMEVETSESVIVTKVESPVAKAVEVHQMAQDKGVMKMRKVERFEFPAGVPVKFEPGGVHLMLIGLKKPLKKGDSVLIKFTLENTDKKQSVMQVDASVRDAPPAPLTTSKDEKARK